MSSNNTKHNDRGFNALINKTVYAVDTWYLNQVAIRCTDGSIFIIETDGQVYGIPLVVCTSENKE